MVNVGKYTIRGAYGYGNVMEMFGNGEIGSQLFHFVSLTAAPCTVYVFYIC